MNLRWTREAVEAARVSYETSTHSHAESEGMLLCGGVGNPAIFAVRGTTFDHGRILTGDALLDGLTTPWRASEYPELGWCHKGFLRGKGFRRHRGALGLYQSAHIDLFNAGPIILTGHSKGAAEAALIAACLVLAGKTVAALITFGMPRVTVTDHLAAVLSSVPQQHFVHGKDVVPTVPAAPWWKRWDHQVYINGGNGLGKTGCFRDHNIAAYQRVILSS